MIHDSMWTGKVNVRKHSYSRPYKHKDYAPSSTWHQKNSLSGPSGLFVTKLSCGHGISGSMIMYAMPSKFSELKLGFPVTELSYGSYGHGVPGPLIIHTNVSCEIW